MMKRVVSILAVVRLASGVLAATVTPNAASNYLFSTPLRPAHIRGLVMGSPPAYYVPRSEDYDWLNEAIREREALASGYWADSLFSTNTVLRPEFGKWNLAETNRFQRWVTAVDAAGVTNVVVGYHLATNTPAATGPGAVYDALAHYQGSYHAGDAASVLWNPHRDGGYLDPDAPLVSGAKAYRAETYTNIYTMAVLTNGLTNATSCITMPLTLTNGTVSVYTNHWTANLRLPAVLTYTNVFASTLLDHCHAGDGFFPGYTNVPPFAAGSVSVPVAFSNDYAALRHATRLAGLAISPTNAPARWGDSSFARGESYTNGPYRSEADIVPTSWTNAVSSVDTNLSYDAWSEYSFRRTHETGKLTVLYEEPDAGGGVWIRSKEVEWFTTRSEESGQQVDTAVLETGFPSDLVTTGGTMRVAVEAVFASVRFRYAAGSNTNYEDRVSISTNVVVRLAGPVLDVSGGRAAVLVAIDPRAICETAAQAAGAPAPPSGLNGDPGAGRFDQWSVAPWDGYEIFYEATPTSRIAGW